MSTIIGIDEAQARLREIILKLAPDDEVVIVENNRPIARLLPSGNPQPQFGGCKDMLEIVADDNKHLEDFRDYMP